MILVSKCLLGECCRYDGKHCQCDWVIRLCQKEEYVAVCPEQMGGLPTPRIPSEQVGNCVVNKEGTDVTDCYRKGASDALRIAKENHCTVAILKSLSPSCGKGVIYDGTFTGGKREGNGMTTEYLLNENIPVFTEQEEENYHEYQRRSIETAYRS
ncbi:MAG: DUF523 domain-containing protein [Erysipelotrichaceae bacterium]|nr:DUF523 domain-containing protein [Erysipelotrichaceae bacterium]